MNYLKCKLMLAGLKHHPAVNVNDLREKMQPYAERYQLRLTEKEILFPDNLSINQQVEFFKVSDGLYSRGIPYNDVIVIDEEAAPGEIALLLRTGYVFAFSQNCPIWKIKNMYHHGQSFWEWIKYSKIALRMRLFSRATQMQ